MPRWYSSIQLLQFEHIKKKRIEQLLLISLRQSERIWYAFKEFCTNQDEIKYENEQDKETLWVKRKEFVENNIINDDDKIFRLDKTRDALWMRERDENNK